MWGGGGEAVHVVWGGGRGCPCSVGGGRGCPCSVVGGRLHDLYSSVLIVWTQTRIVFRGMYVL